MMMMVGIVLCLDTESTWIMVFRFPCFFLTTKGQLHLHALCIFLFLFIHADILTTSFRKSNNPWKSHLLLQRFVLHITVQIWECIVVHSVVSNAIKQARWFSRFELSVCFHKDFHFFTSFNNIYIYRICKVRCRLLSATFLDLGRHK